MSRSLIRHAAFLMLIVVVTNFIAWGISKARFEHELDHAGRIELAASAHQHLRHAVDQADDRTPSAAEHQALHAVDHLQLFPGTNPGSGPDPAVSGVPPVHFAQQSLPLPTFDPPFRPPA